MRAKVLLVVVALFSFGSAGRAQTLCEDAEVIHKVDSIIFCIFLSCREIMPSAKNVDDIIKNWEAYLDAFKGMRSKSLAVQARIKEIPNFEATYEKSINTVINSLKTSIFNAKRDHISDARAIDFNRDIGRYVCEANMNFDEEETSSWIVSVLILTGSHESFLALDAWTHREKAESKLAFDAMRKFARNIGASYLKYSAQQTRSGVIVSVIK